ncbi:MAG: glycosyltransferase family 39 protein [Chloroflexota bacterium]
MKFSSLGSLLGRSVLVLLLLAGLLLIWSSFQPFESISPLVNSLAADGNLESFTPERFAMLALPLGLAGGGLVVISILALIYWKKTVALVQGAKVSVVQFCQLLLPDMKNFGADLRWKSQPNLDRIAMLGIALLAILPRLADLNASISHDEAYTYNAFASGSLWTTISDYHLPNNHILLSVLINITTKLVGNQPWALRIPSLLAGVTMIPVAYLLARRLYGRETAILAAGMVAVFPKLVEYSSAARGYILLELISLALLGLADYARTKENRFAWTLLAVFSALGFFTIPIMLFPFGAIFLWLFLSALVADVGDAYRSRFGFLKYWFWSGMGAAALTLVLYAPVLLKDAGLLLGNRFVRALDWNGYPFIILERLLDTWGQWTANLPEWLALVGVIGLASSLVLHWWIARHKVPAQVAFALWIMVVLAVKRPNAEPKVWSFLIAFLLIWAAAGIVELLKKLPFLARATTFSKTLLALVLGLLAVNNALIAPTIPQKWNDKGGLEIAVEYLDSHLQEGDLVIVGVTYAPQFYYLFDINDIPIDYIRHDGPYQRAFIVISPRAGGDLEQVLNKFAPESPPLDMDSITLVKKFGAFEIYQAFASAPTP